MLPMRRQLLIVEDQLAFLECLRSYLTERGHEVLTASTVPEALRWLDQTCPDMALVDLRLAIGHGLGVIQEIVKRQLPIRIVVITGCDDLEMRQQLLAYGVSDYLFKPIALRDLDRLFTSY